MSEPLKLGLDALVDVLKAAGEPTRLRLLALLDGGDLTVTDLTEILGQSQPRISRHLKLLGEAELIERYQEGAWAYFRLKQDGKAAMLVRALLKHVSENDPTILRDGERLSQVKRQRAERAQAYFSRNAAEWDELRRLHAADEEVDAAVIRLLGNQPIDSLLDLGTGTGRILELLSGLYRRAIGVDASRDMLSVARANLDKSRITKATVRPRRYPEPAVRGTGFRPGDDPSSAAFLRSAGNCDRGSGAHAPAGRSARGHRPGAAHARISPRRACACPSRLFAPGDVRVAAQGRARRRAGRRSSSGSAKRARVDGHRLARARSEAPHGFADERGR